MDTADTTSEPAAPDGPRERLPRFLDPVEIRVVASLLEKERLTPDVYPMTIKGLVAACNQKSNREPVMDLDEDEVEAALERLLQDVLVWRVQGPRSVKWRATVERRWHLDEPATAVLTLLMLRGAQTAGELRARSERLHGFDTTEEVEAVLEDLAAGPEPLVARLARQPGQREERWVETVGGPPEEGALAAEPASQARPPSPTRAPRAATPSALEERLAAVEARLARLEEALGLEDE